MAFNFRVVFTGICTFVRHVDGGAMMALMVDGRDAEAPGLSKKVGLDDKTLDRHRGFLKFHLRDAWGNAPFGGEGVWYPDGHRITFVPRGVGKKPFKIGPIAQIPDLTRIAPQYATVDPQALRKVNPHSGSAQVLAQVLIRDGEISQDGSSISDVKWNFSDVLGGLPPDITNVKLAHRLTIDMGDLESLVVRVQETSSGNAPVEELLTFRGLGGTVILEISNLCETDPLGWGRKRRFAQDDVDFRWHYELLKNQSQIQGKLGPSGQRRYLPHPTPVERRSRTQQELLSSPLERLLHDYLRSQDAKGEVIEASAENLKELKIGELFEVARGRGEAALGNNCYGSFAADGDVLGQAAELATRPGALQGEQTPSLTDWLDAIDPEEIEDVVKELAGLHTRFTGGAGYGQAIDIVRSRIANQARTAGAVGTVPFEEGEISATSVEVVYGVDVKPIVLVAAHLDSINAQGGPDAAAPGANDNASGVAGLVAIKKVLDMILARGGRLNRQIRLLFVGGEEQDLIGSAAYRAQLEADGLFDEVDSVLNLDMIAAGPAGRAVVYGKRSLGEELRDLGEELAGLDVKVKGGGYSSDHLSFRPRRAVSIVHEGDDRGQRHTDADVVDDRLDFGLAAAITKMNLAYLLINAFESLPERP